MTAPAWFPFYIGDYLKDTGNLTALGHGAYLLLILHYWQHGGLPSDEDELAAIARLSEPEWQKMRSRLSKFFHSGWKHKRVDEELAKAQQTIAKRKASGKAGAEARYSKGKANGTEDASQTNAPTPSKNSYSSENLEDETSRKEERRVEVSPSDPVLQRPDDPLAAYSDSELKALQFEFDGLDVDSAICELSAWCDRRGITDPIERKNAIYGGMKKRHAKAKLYDSMQTPEAASVSPQLAKSRLVTKGPKHIAPPEFLVRS